MPKIVVPKSREKLPKKFLGGGLTPPQFMPSYYEWIRKHSQQVLEFDYEAFGGAAEINLYTVPDDYIFYLTDMQMILLHTGVAGLSEIYFMIAGEGKFMLTNYLARELNLNTLSFRIPLEFKEKEILKIIRAGIEPSIYGGFIKGFLVKKSMIPQI